MPASLSSEAPVRRVFVLLALAVAVICQPGLLAQVSAPQASAPIHTHQHGRGRDGPASLRTGP